jgi:chaperonin GroES
MSIKTTLSDRIIVELIEFETMIGSVIMPTKGENQKTKGIIKSIGVGCKYLKVKEGDEIIYKKYAGTRMAFDDKDCVILREPELDAVIKDGVVIPLADRVIVKPNKPKEETVGGIIIPDSGKEKQLNGEVVSTGKGKPKEPIQVSKEDVVVFGRHSGAEVIVNGVECLIMRESDIVCIL